MLANVQREIATAQARDHVVRRPDCSRCDGVCRMKDYRDHAVATLFGQVTIKLPRFRCARCGGTETGIGWPSHCRSTPELDRIRAHLSSLMTYRVAADLLEQVFLVDAGTDPETLGRHTLRAGEALADCAATRPETAAPAIAGARTCRRSHRRNRHRGLIPWRRHEASAMSSWSLSSCLVSCCWWTADTDKPNWHWPVL